MAAKAHPYMMLLLILNMGLVVWSATFSPIPPTLPPPPTPSIVINNSLAVLVGEPATVGEDVRVTIDCGLLIEEAINNGISDPNITWYKDGLELSNGSVQNVVISADRRFCIVTDTLLPIGGTVGNNGQYTCEACNDTNCIKTSRLIVCGYPNLVPPASPPLVLPSFIVLTCGQDIIVETLVGVNGITILCTIFNASSPLETHVFKNNDLISNNFPLIIMPTSDDDFDTYTFVVSTKWCGTTNAVSRILRQVHVFFNESMYHVNENAGSVQPLLVLSYPSTTGVTVQVFTTSVSVIGGGVAEISVYTVTIPAGVTSVPFDIPINDDDIYEGNENITVTIDPSSLPTNVNVSDPSHVTVTIVDDDHCSLTAVSGRISYNPRTKRITFRFSSDGDSSVIYRCRLDDARSRICNGRNRMVWKNLREGRHSIYLKAYCINNEMKRYIIVRKRFRFRIRRNNFIPLYGAS